MLKPKSYWLKPEKIEKKWFHVDATGQTVGRLATMIADILRGKNKPTYTPNVDSGDFVVVTNCEKVKFTGKKWTDKNYFWHTNNIGGIKARTATEQLQKHPELIIFEAVKGMVPNNTLGRKQMTKLKVFVGAAHEHEAQKPETIQLMKK